MKLLTLLVAALLLTAWPAPAQEHVFTPGGRLRIEAPRVFNGRLEGVVREFTHEGLSFEASASGQTYLLATTEIRYLAKYRGYDRPLAMKQRARSLGFVGGAVGAIAGPGFAIAMGSENLLLGSAIGALSGVVTGAGVGVVLGSRYQGEVWREYRIIGHARQPAAR